MVAVRHPGVPRRVPARPTRTPAGTLAVAEQTQHSVVHVFGYDAEDFVETPVFDPAALASLRARWKVVWVHVVGLGDARVLETLGSLFGVHRLALADVVSTEQRPKYERFGELTQIIVRMLEAPGSAATEQLSILVGKGFVLSFEERDGDLFAALRQRIRGKLGRVRESGPDFLAYGLVDMVVDAYFPALERIGDELDRIEDELLDAPPLTMSSRLRAVKRELVETRRALWPLREVLTTMAADAVVVNDETRLYLRDCQDRCAQLLDLLASYRELAADLVDQQVSVAGQRMNEVMKVLTVMASVFIPLTFISSLYGMNFDPDASPFNMPELRWAFGYPFALLLMLVTACGLVSYFRRRGWI